MPLTATQQAIVAEARANGLDPVFALAVASRESGFDPNAKASKTIRGIFQMSKPLREQYGHGDSTDPTVQTRAFAAYMKDVTADLKHRLGREPTNNELYLAHHFGPGRAAQMASGRLGAETPVDQVFTPYERSINPHFDKAGTTGALTNGIYADLGNRQRKFGRLMGDDSAPRPPQDVPTAQTSPPAPTPATDTSPARPYGAVMGVAPLGAPTAPPRPYGAVMGVAPLGAESTAEPATTPTPAPESAPLPRPPPTKPPEAKPATDLAAYGAPADTPEIMAAGQPGFGA